MQIAATDLQAIRQRPDYQQAVWEEAKRRRRAQNLPAQYWNDPAAFVLDCFDWRKGEEPTPYQIEILEAIVEHKRVAVRGPHGLGKTALAAWLVLWFALTRDGTDWKIPTTASAWRQLTKFLWPEIGKWARRLKWGKLNREPFSPRAELLTQNLKLRTGEAFAVASDNPDLIEGAHATNILYVYDEAKAIPPKTFDAAEGAFSGAGSDTDNEAYAFAPSTPGEPNGRFYDINRRKAGYEDWWVRHVRLSECIAAGRISSEWAANRKRQWGEKSAVYQNRVVGEFASSEEDGIIPLAWVEAANERWHELNESGDWGDFTAVGVDVARSGEDQTVQALRYGNNVKELRRTVKEDTMQTVGRVKGVLDARGGMAIVDVIGIGAGVVDRLREQGYQVSAFNAAEGTDMRDDSNEFGFVNTRAAAWWNMRQLLDPANEHNIALPPEDGLIGDLTAPKYRVMSGAKYRVEEKKEIKKRLGRSTDDADAVIQAFWTDTAWWAW